MGQRARTAGAGNGQREHARREHEHPLPLRVDLKTVESDHTSSVAESAVRPRPTTGGYAAQAERLPDAMLGHFNMM